ncbi:energy transducer TonB [Pseudomonas syringae]|nr:energy transducer TonB [Pseudomonas syringae]
MTSLKVRLGNHSAPSPWVAQTPCATPKTHHLRLWVAGGLTAVAAHCLLILAMLMSPSTKRLELLSAPAAPASVRVTMIAAPTPQLPPVAEAAPVTPTPPAPQVMTSEAAERAVAAPPPKPTPPKPPKPAKPPRAPVAPHKPALTEPTAQPPAAPNVPAAAITAPSADGPEKTLQLPAAGPKDVNTIGCRVPAPEYPRKAKRLKLEGETLIRLVVNAQGKIDQAEVARSAGNADLDAAARQAVLGASCTPYIENGHPVAVRALQPVSFRLTR